MSQKRVLFLCTGNYYRSRFAEELFNFKASKVNLPYLSDSAALAIETGTANVGPISWYAVDALQSRGIKLGEAVRYPKAVSIVDLESAFIIVAMDKSEHHPMIAERLPDWLERITYWNVADIEFVEPDEALGKIERLVDNLIRSLSGE